MRPRRVRFALLIPAPLPPSPAVRLEGELQRRLSMADQALGRLDGSIHTLPDPDLFVYSTSARRTWTKS
jgi:hypothetical protein